VTTKRAWLAPLALAALVAAVIVTISLVASRGGDNSRGSSRPALLHLASDTGAVRVAAEPADNGDATPGGSAYVLDGTLPDEQPADQPVWRVAAADGDAAAGIAKALGFHGSPTRIDGGWVLRTPGANRLLVRDDGSWSLGMDCFANQPLSDESADVMCAAAAGGSVAVAVPPADAPDATASPDPGNPPDPVDPPQPVPTFTNGPTTSAARADADAILRGLGLADARVTVTEGTPTTTVQASYDVHDTTTVGFDTTLSFDGNDQLVSADGWLPDVARGDTYPVVTAQRAFELLQQQPRPMMEMCLRRPDGQPGCADVPPAVITGATLGLSMAQDNGRPTLVPAWLFTVKGQDDPLVQIAVEPSYLAPPATATDGPSAVPPNSGDTKPDVTPVGASPA
jgi:hypothetical protein